MVIFNSYVKLPEGTPEIWCSALYSTLLAGSSSRDCRPCLVKKSPVFMQKCVDVVPKTPVFMLKSPVLILKFLVSLIKFLVFYAQIPVVHGVFSCPQSTTCRHVPHLCAPAGPNSTLGFHKDATCHQHHDVTPVCDEKFTQFTPCLVNLYIYIIYIYIYIYYIYILYIYIYIYISCISLVTRGHLKT